MMKVMQFVSHNWNLMAKKIENQLLEFESNSSIMEYALNGHLEVLKWAREIGCPWNEDTCSNIAKNGHFEVLKWDRENRCSWDRNTCNSATFSTSLEVLKWFREWLFLNEDTCDSAAKNEHLKVLKWARENGCPWNEYLFKCWGWIPRSEVGQREQLSLGRTLAWMLTKWSF